MRSVVVVLLCAGCFGPKYPSGTVPCALADKSCPSGEVCGADGLCYDTSQRVDECMAMTDKCSPHASCTDQPAGYTCMCKAGYTGDGFTCNDVDECAMGVDACDPHATCANTDGAYTCTCNPGFSGDGRICSDVDECTAGTDDCDPNAACLNNPGSFTCSCNTGYTGDGTSCATAWLTATAGETATCGIRTTGSLWCWGQDYNDELGDGDPNATNKLSPEQIGTDEDWTAVSSHDAHTCALRGAGALYCWGGNSYGQIGDGTTAPAGTPEAIAPATMWAVVASGGVHTCAIDELDALWCWGYGGGGALGANNTNQSLVPQKVSDGPWSAVAGGYDHTCGISGGHLFCWGTNDYGQLATGDEKQKNVPTQVGNATWLAVSAGDYHTCALRADGTLWCWGLSSSGQLGDGQSGGTATPVLAPTSVIPGHTFTSLAAGAYHGCAVESSGKLWCWGSGTSGQVGDGHFQVRPTPLQVGADTDWQQVTAGNSHSCAIKTDGRLLCWGDNQSGEIGLGVGGIALSPENPDPTDTWKALTVGEYENCALHTDGSLWCWGWNLDGTLGIARDDGAIIDTPQPVDAGAAYAAVAPSVYHTCGVRTNGNLFCWGDDNYGELGDGAVSTTPVDTPEMIGPDQWLQIATGYYFTCGLEADGSLWCWGDDGSGEVGDPAAPNPATAPHLVGTDKTWTQIAAAGSHACGIKGGALFCWGSNYYGESGQSPLGGTITAPRQVGTDTTWTLVGVGSYNGCGLRGSELSCWGDDSSHQLADGDTTAKATPVRIGSAAWKDIAVADDHICSVRTDGAMFCWGSNYTGELGDGTETAQNVPEQINPSVTWAEVAAGSSTGTCALDGGGLLWCWGAAWTGQLANDATGYETPEQLP